MLYNLQTDIICFIVLGLLCFRWKDEARGETEQGRLLLGIIIYTMILTGLDMFNAHFEGRIFFGSKVFYTITLTAYVIMIAVICWSLLLYVIHETCTHPN